MKYWGIQKRLLIITLLPCLIIAVALGGYFSFERHQQLQDHATEQAILLSRQLAIHSSELFNPARLNQARLNQATLNQAALNDYLNLPQLRALALLNNKQETIIAVGPKMLELSSNRIIEQETHRFHTANSLRIRAPIFAQNDSLHSQLLGWVELEFNSELTTIAQYKSLLISLLLIIGAGLLALYFAYRASARITKPLQHVATALAQLENGNLESRIQLSEQEEFNELANGINSMAASLQRAQQELQDNIEQATQDLKETMEEMEVQNIELNLARREALDASKTKSDFLANMSHEIRTPLNGILGFSKLLEKTRLNKRQQEYLGTIESSSSSLLSIINDILDFSKIEAGKLVLDRIPMHIRDITDEVLTMLAPEAHKKGIELTALVYEDVPHEIMADPVRIKQVLTNLINNAIKFTESGSVIVRIMLEEIIQQQASLKFTITDTGIGMSPDQQANLFEAFNQADASTTRRFGGTGLGLVISRYLVENMQGEIGLESQSGVGSQFWFSGKFEVCDAVLESWLDAPWQQKHAYLYCTLAHTKKALQHHLQTLGLHVHCFSNLPELLAKQKEHAAAICLIEVDEIRDNQHIQLLKQSSQVIALLPNNDNLHLKALEYFQLEHSLVYPIAFRHLSDLLQDLFEQYLQTDLDFSSTPQTEMTVLAVDDNQPNLELLSTWLQDLKVNVVRASGGIEAVKFGTEQKFDLIFMDIQMPDLDGVSATEQIRQHSMNRQTPLVALTAHALPNERKKLMQNGFDDYLTKPISEEQLLHTLTKWTHFKRNYKHSRHSYSHSKASLPLRTTSIVDWQQCLKLAGGKTQLAKTMLEGLISEAKILQSELSAQPNKSLLELVHKTHGLCKYVGAENLRKTLENAETCLKTTCDTWPLCQKELHNAIEDLLSWDKESQWLEQLNETSYDY